MKLFKNKNNITEASNRFVENLRSATNNFSKVKRPLYIRSPFSSKPFTRRGEINVQDVTVNDMPEITYYTDTHLVAPQLVNEGYEGLASGKRRFFGLSKLHVILRHVRLLDDISYIMLEKIRPYIRNRYRRGGLVIHGGDVIDSYEAGNCFRTFAALERFRENAIGDIKPAKANHIWITGNHDAFFGGLGQWFEYNNFRRSYYRIPQESFRAIVAALKAGWPWQLISKTWKKSYIVEGVVRKRRTIKCALHPALRWYLEKLTFGPAQGLFVSKHGKNGTATNVYFLDSELVTLHGGAGALDRSLRSEGFAKSSQLYKEIMRWRRQEHKAQVVLVNSLRQALIEKRKVVVYTHNPRQQQGELIEKTHTERRFIEQRVTIYGGHYHSADKDIIKMPPGVRPARGATRIFLGPFGQKQGLFPFAFSFKEYLGGLAPEILDGPIAHPQTVTIIGVKEAVERNLHI